MGGFPLLVGYCAAMFLGAYVSGWVTTAMQSTRSARLNRWLAIFGAGLLVGTALIVIIPEGVAMYYEALKTQEEALHSTHVHLPPGTKIIPKGTKGIKGKTAAAGAGGGGAAAGARRLGPASFAAGGRSLIEEASSKAILVPELTEQKQQNWKAATPAEAAGAGGAATSRERKTRAKTKTTTATTTTTTAAAAAGSAKSANEGEEGEEEDDGHDAEGGQDDGHAHGGTDAATAASSEKGPEEEEGHQHSGHSHGGGAAIGAALVLGFAFQLIVGELLSLAECCGGCGGCC